MTMMTLLIFSLSFTSCGLFKKKSKHGHTDSAMIDEGDFEELEGDFEELEGEEIVLDDERRDEELNSEVEVASEQMTSSISTTSGELSSYRVQKNDTLMLIAFKLYGDYDMWRNLKSWNNLRSSSLSVGQTLQYKTPDQAFEWNPTGTPYMIRQGDSLSKISNNVYGTWKYWNNIFQHNRPMIKRANMIFAGFTLYYPAKESVVAVSYTHLTLPTKA